MILRKIKNQGIVSSDELQKFIENETVLLQDIDETLKIGSSKRTLQRDIKDINNLFGISIVYSPSQKGYYIEESEFENINFQRLLDEFQIYQSLNIAEDIKPFVNVEPRKSQGLENLHGILHAIRNRLIVKYTYNFFDINQIYTVVAEPYALKEFKNRWYLVAKDCGDKFVKTFALERISDFEVTGKQFFLPQNFDIKAFFRNSFGILTHLNEKPEKIVLQFNSMQSRYIKLKPLHHSQKILKDSDNELNISLLLQNTFDFRMELLSYGNSLKVLEPESLKNQLIDIYKSAIKNY